MHQTPPPPKPQTNKPKSNNKKPNQNKHQQENEQQEKTPCKAKFTFHQPEVLTFPNNQIHTGCQINP